MSAHPASATSVPAPRAGIRLPGLGAGLGRGLVVLYLSILVLLPLAALTNQSLTEGLGTFWDQVTTEQALRSLELTLVASAIVVVINAFFGTILAWLLVRDDFPGKAAINAVIDLPFALPTIVASLILLELWGARSPFGIDIAATQASIVVALCFVTLPFVVRAVQPLLMEMDREMEEAAASLGAGIALAFARALGEYGSVLLFAGGLPDTTVSSVYIRNQIESGNDTGAAAVSVVLLLASLLCLVIVGLIQRWAGRHERPAPEVDTTIMPFAGSGGAGS
jgi:sulfate transport system permease protein